MQKQIISVSFDPTVMSIYLFRVNLTNNEITCDGVLNDFTR
jgi:hypothetical protein